jgi:hypothetical protein
VNLKSITTTLDRMPSDFKDAVAMLKRPYTPVSEKVYKAILKKVEGVGDVVIFKNKRMTFGAVDCGYALMPLAAQ